MALIIEDGSIVADANSYVSVAETRLYAEARGIALPTDDADLEILLIKSMDYLEAQRSKYQGLKVESTQSLQWPRYDVYIDCVLFSQDEIPVELKSAEMQLAIEANSGTDLMPTRCAGFVTEEKVGVLNTKYSESIATGAGPNMTAVKALLAPLYYPCGSGTYLKTLRV